MANNISYHINKINKDMKILDNRITNIDHPSIKTLDMDVSDKLDEFKRSYDVELNAKLKHLQENIDQKSLNKIVEQNNEINRQKNQITELETKIEMLDLTFTEKIAPVEKKLEDYSLKSENDISPNLKSIISVLENDLDNVNDMLLLQQKENNEIKLKTYENSNTLKTMQGQFKRFIVLLEEDIDEEVDNLVKRLKEEENNSILFKEQLKHIDILKSQQEDFNSKFKTIINDKSNEPNYQNDIDILKSQQEDFNSKFKTIINDKSNETKHQNQYNILKKELENNSILFKEQLQHIDILKSQQEDFNSKFKTIYKLVNNYSDKETVAKTLETLEEVEPGEETVKEVEPGEETVKEVEPGEETVKEVEPGEETVDEVETN